MRQSYFKRGADIPQPIRNRTRYSMTKWGMSLNDAFREAVRHFYSIAPYELQNAFMEDDYRNYIPSVYFDWALTPESMSVSLYDAWVMHKEQTNFDDAYHIFN